MLVAGVARPIGHPALVLDGEVKTYRLKFMVWPFVVVIGPLCSRPLSRG